MGYEVSFWKSRSFVYAELNETVEATTSSYSATDEFLRYIYSVLVSKNHENIQSRCLVHEFSFTDIFLNSTLYGCDFLMLLWKSAQTIGPAIISYLLKYFYSFSAAELNNIESEDEVLRRNFHVKRVIMEIVMMKILNNCISGRLNSNYFPLNESPSHY